MQCMFLSCAVSVFKAAGLSRQSLLRAHCSNASFTAYTMSSITCFLNDVNLCITLTRKRHHDRQLTIIVSGSCTVVTLLTICCSKIVTVLICNFQMHLIILLRDDDDEDWVIFRTA